MDPQNLQTAATYINNLLLARGLLRNGKPIELAHLVTAPTDGPDAKSHAKASITATAEIINLVHDLILRRDRDQEQHESLAVTLRNLRGDAARQAAGTERLRGRNQDLARQLAAQQSSARCAQAAAHAAEGQARALRDDLARLKSILGQVRAQCANDVRKRDVQIQKLKTHLAARQRGNKTGLVGSSISITPGQTGRAPAAAAGPGGAARDGDAPNLEDAEYSLKQETTEFLTQLGQGLSDENDALIGVIRNTVNILRELQGLPHNRPQVQRGHGSADDSFGSDHVDTSTADGLVSVSPASHQTLSRELESVLGSLSELLTNPSFAPIEEVQTREEEIQRLREGWEKMEGRWREAVVMMQGWRKRMMAGGNTVSLEDLKMGLCLGDGLGGGANNLFGASTLQGTTGHPADEHEIDDGDRDSQPGDDLHSDGASLDELAIPGPDNPAADDLLDLRVSDDLRAGRELAERDANVEPSARPQKDRVSFDVAAKENVKAPRTQKAALGKRKADTVQSHGKARAPSSRTTVDSPKAKSRAGSLKAKSITKTNKRPSTHRSSPSPDLTLSVEQKLQIAEREARRASSSSTGSIDPPPPQQSSLPPELEDKALDGAGKGRMGAGTKGLQADHEASAEQKEVEKDEGKAKTLPVKRTRIGGRPRKRKSTLSPDELEELMMGPGGVEGR